MKQFRTRYNVDHKKVSQAYAVSFLNSDGTFRPGRTKGSFKDECDVNKILDRFAKTGQVPTGMRQISEAHFADVSDSPSYQEAIHAVRSAEDLFMALPAVVRRECDNDPAVFMDRLQDRAWAESHGLLSTPSQPKTAAVKAAVSAGQALVDPDDDLAVHEHRVKEVKAKPKKASVKDE